MHTKIQKWGNSQGIRIPKSILSSLDISLNDEIEITAFDGKIIILPVKKHISLKDRLKNYDGNYDCSEWDTGNSVGNEVL